MPWGFYGRGRGSWGRRRGLGNPYPHCRFYPWLPRGWWRFGALPYGDAYGRPLYGRRSPAYGPSRDVPYGYPPRP